MLTEIDKKVLNVGVDMIEHLFKCNVCLTQGIEKCDVANAYSIIILEIKEQDDSKRNA